MIKNIYIDNFKLYKSEVNIPLTSLNLLTGVNGKGKSSVLQVLLLLSQSVQTNRATNKIYLNGDNVKLGSFGDVKNRETSFLESIHFGFKFDKSRIDYLLHHTNSDATELFVESISAMHDDFKFSLSRKEDWYAIKLKSDNSTEQHQFSLFDFFIGHSSIEQNFSKTILATIRSEVDFLKIHYVSADRIGPKNYYENKSLNHFVSVGALGENTVNVLHHKGNEKVNETVLKGYCRIFDENIDDLSWTIEDNTNYWIDRIFQGAKVQVEAIKGEDLLKLRINSDGKSVYFKPTNVGYGFSYSLPIIIAGLISKPGEILIIENPEAHLHPYAQSILAKFLSIISSSGVQVVIESHSEHILNGIRVTIKDSIVNANDVNVLYFDSKADTFFEKIYIDKDGGIDNWPRNFFDQATNDLNYLLGI